MSVSPTRTLAGRISLLAAAVAVITALLAGALAVGLIIRANADAARRTLSRLADAAQSAAEQGISATASQDRARRTLQAIKVQSVLVNAQGTITEGGPLGRAAVTPADISTLLAGGDISTQRRVDGADVLIEGRPTPAGGIVLLQRRTDATAAGAAAIRRTLVALAIGVVIAVVLGALLAHRITGPLRRTAEAARALAHGRRDVSVAPQGPVEVAEVAAAVNTLSAELAQSEGRQRDFLLSVSHDLRTPMTALTGYAESLADGVAGPEDTQRIGRIMLGESRRLERLVSDLLDLARIGARDFRIDPQRIDVAAVAREAATVWSERCRAAGPRFRLELADETLPCVTDPARLRQALDGLLENALRVTPAGAPIVLGARAGAGEAILDVRDGGPGLRDEDLAVAFERSALYDRYRGIRPVGTGLGLAIVHSLVERLGGTVEAGHAEEGGARFTIRIPAESP